MSPSKQGGNYKIKGVVLVWLKRWWWLARNRKKLRFLMIYLTDSKVSIVKKLWVLAPLVYLLLPTDLIPDFLLGLGFMDDILVILLLFGKIQRDLKLYIMKHNQSRNQTENRSVVENIEYKIHDK